MHVDDRAVIEAFDKAPKIMRSHIRKGLRRGGIEVARLARRLAPKAFSTLTQSIKQTVISDFRVDVIAAANYARAVEEGTGPGGRPPVQTIKDWLKVRRIKPRNPDMDIDDLAHIISRSIAKRGTPAQPFMQPAVERKENRLRDLLERSTWDGIRAAGL